MDFDTIEVDLQKRAHEVCSELLGGTWSKISSSEICLSQLSGGASNLLYCCSLPSYVIPTNGELTQILIRFYGNQSQTEEIAIQCEIFDLLSKKNLGPKLYGIFNEGRLEEFLPANSLTCEEIRNYEISRIIAKKLAVVHSLNVPINKDESWLIERLTEWSNETRTPDVELPDVESNGIDSGLSTKEIISELFSIDFRQEIEFIRDEIFEKSNSIKVFSHNDLHQGNILFAEPSKRRPTLTERIVFIDFEYCSYNYRAYDIANHLCEWLFQYGTPEFPHYICYMEKFPTLDDQLNFIHHYLSEIYKIQDTQEGKLIDQIEVDDVCNDADCKSLGDINLKNHRNLSTDDEHQSTNGNDHSTKNNNNNNNTTNGMNTHQRSAMERSISLNGCTKDKKTDFKTNGDGNNKLSFEQNKFTDEEKQLFEEIQPFYLAVSLFWTLWCMKQAQTSTIKFGYWQHAMDRWKLYQNFKTSYLNATTKVESDSS